MERLKDLVERRKIRKTLTVASLRERLLAYRKLKELQQHVKKRAGARGKAFVANTRKARSEANAQGTQE